jgi:pre-mRNA-splicing factor SYF2
MQRLRDLHAKRNEARKLNHLEVVEEDRRNKLPANWEARKRRVEWELEDHRKREEAEARGDDYERVKLLETGADEAARMDRLRTRKRANKDVGFSTYEDATRRQLPFPSNFFESSFSFFYYSVFFFFAMFFN